MIQYRCRKGAVFVVSPLYYYRGGYMGKKFLGEERLGLTKRNTQDSLMKIVEYTNTDSIIVEFEQGNHTKTTWTDFCKGKVRNVYDRTVFGVGYLGEGKYTQKDNTQQYITWQSMLARCYSDKYHDRYPSYKDCSVDNEWHNFQKFAEWFDSNYYEVEGEKMCLDKDIVSKGNKIYSPNVCMFVPNKINIIMSKGGRARGDLPVGVSLTKEKDKYRTTLGRKHLGSYNTAEEAFLAYKKAKEEYICKVAEEYKGAIPLKLYYALINYEVDIND